MEEYVGAEEASKFLGIKIQTLYSWKCKGIIPCYKPNGKKGRVLFKVSELDAFMQERREGGQ